jgi:hypothetical protein
MVLKMRSLGDTLGKNLNEMMRTRNLHDALNHRMIRLILNRHRRHYRHQALIS